MQYQVISLWTLNVVRRWKIERGLYARGLWHFGSRSLIVLTEMGRERKMLLGPECKCEAEDVVIEMKQ